MLVNIALNVSIVLELPLETVIYSILLNFTQFYSILLNSTQFYSIWFNISGGAAVLQAFGRAADNLLPDLVFSWVTGGQSNQKKPTARLNDEDDEQLEPRIIAGKYHLFWITPPSYA